MPTWSLTVELPIEESELTSDALFELGASGVEVRDGSYAPMPNAPPVPLGRAVVVAWFSDRADALEAQRALEVEAKLDEHGDQDWGEKWKEGWKPFSVGRVFVRPSWITAATPPGAIEVVLDPGMAFGTGTHSTTALCMAALDRLLAAKPGASVIDVGTGSGLLAIAAKKLGAGRVAGCDNDPVAVKVAQENCEQNGVEAAMTGEDISRIEGKYDVVVANILANTLVMLAPALEARLAAGADLLLSGILVPQEEEVAAAYRALGLAQEAGARDGEWSLLHFRKDGQP